MADISIVRNHTLGKSPALERIKGIEPKLKEKYGVKLEWSGDHAQLKGSGVSGQVQVTDNRISIEVKLGLLLKPLTGKIRESLERQVDKALV